jgi:WD40 repeat protein
MVNLIGLCFVSQYSLLFASVGDRLALCTNGGSNLHMLRIYDVKSQQPSAMQVTVLEPFFTTGVSEVNCASFSSDGVYLVIGRSDDCVHVYDSRMLDRGPVLPFEHSGSARNSPGNGPYGIVEAKWVSTFNQRLGLVSGGTDGRLEFNLGSSRLPCIPTL